MTRRLVFWITLSFGVFMLFQFFIPVVGGAYRKVLDWMQVIYLSSLLVGVIALGLQHLRKVSTLSSGWGYSLVTVAGLVAMPVAAFWGTGESSVFFWLFNNMQVPMQSTVFSLLAFFVASAAFRGFRARSLPAFLLLVSAAIVMLGRVPIGTKLYFDFPAWSQALLDIPSVAARRGILIGIGLGSVATSLRVILGIERGFFGRKV
ncbi:MAG: hypothetical protein L0196_06475 [candidate division Zixibacteria bacterium]|nr:hypothetical protein [candidate division Zixibacteria bacterium]